MRDHIHDKLGLLMAPALLPSCFSFEEDRVPPLSAVPAAARSVRLRQALAAFRREVAARAAASRNSSAAAW